MSKNDEQDAASPRYGLRVLQIDLARQIESLGQLRMICDFAAAHGYNALGFYLEDRVKTAAYPDSPDEESYSPEQMRDITAYAAERGLEVIPVVSTLGHTERFLRHPRLRHLAEGRDGDPQRMGDGFNCVCPSLDESMAFWKAYLHELTEIFPSRYFHIGGDEAWNLCTCARCRERVAKGETIGDIYAAHVREIHAFLSARGKQVILWDDMLEEHPDILEGIPRDVVLCVWQYDTRVDQTRTHFGFRVNDHRLATYRSQGRPFLIAPWAAVNLLNATSFTRYAEPYRPAGGWMTNWEGAFFQEVAPTCGVTGRLWSAPERSVRTCFPEAAEWFFGEIAKDEVFRSALYGILQMSDWPVFTDVRSLWAQPVSGYAEEFRNQRTLQACVLRRSQSECPPDGPGAQWIEIKLLRLALERLQFDVQDRVCDIQRERLDGRPAPIRQVEALEALLPQLDDLAARWEAVARRCRGDVPEGVSPIHRRVTAFRASVESFLNRLRCLGAAESFLFIGYALPDHYGAPRVKLGLRRDADEGWRTFYAGNPKPSFRDLADRPYFSSLLSLGEAFADAPPSGIRIEVSGFGGIGIRHLRVHVGGRTYVPVSVVSKQGEVRGAACTFVDDSRWCWMGALSTEGAIASMDPPPVHSLELTLGDRPSEWV